jgi:hypothetical protein
MTGSRVCEAFLHCKEKHVTPVWNRSDRPQSALHGLWDTRHQALSGHVLLKRSDVERKFSGHSTGQEHKAMVRDLSDVLDQVGFLSTLISDP